MGWSGVVKEPYTVRIRIPIDRHKLNNFPTDAIYHPDDILSIALYYYISSGVAVAIPTMGICERTSMAAVHEEWRQDCQCND